MASYAWDIVAACESVLGDDAAFDAATIDIRERPYYDPERDSLPLLVLTPETEKPVGETQGNVIEVEYPVQFTYIQAGNLVVSDRDAIQDRLTIRQAIRQRLHRPTLEGVSTVFDATYEPDPTYDVSAIDRALRVSRQRLTFRNNEARSN